MTARPYQARLLCFFLFALHLLPSRLPAQDFGWWNERHDWDGFSPWPSYLIISPAFMGPNALPVPDVKTGKIATAATLNLSLEKHDGGGDQTENLFLEGFVPLFSPRVGLNLQFVPIERYRMDTITRDERRARDRDGRGTATGDVYLGTYVQLLEENDRRPGVLLTINLKTASGGKLSAARFTDAPGYFFDLSVGKTFERSQGFLRAWRPYVMGGFYVWQRFETNSLQNDSVLYGLGLDLDLGALQLSNALGGYLGYLGDGDQPVVYRLTLTTQRERAVNYAFRLQHGLNDFGFTSFRLTGSLDLGRVLGSKKPKG